MAGKLRSAVGRVVRPSQAPSASAAPTEERRLKELTDRVAALEAEVQECRTLNLRLAELTDLVQELLLPIAARDQDKVAELLARYRDSI